MRPRVALATLACIALAGCAPVRGGPQTSLDDRLGMRVAGLAVARSLPDAAPVLWTEGCAVFADDGVPCARKLTSDDPVRIASISKLVTVIGLMRLAEEHQIDLDADASTVLGFVFRNPAFPDREVSLRHLLSHTSGVRDGEDSVIPLGVSVRDFMANGTHWDGANAPGAHYAYSNLGIVIVATAMEGIARERFDRLMQRLVFAPLGLEARYNWSGASPQSLTRAAALYRTARDDGVWDAEGPWIAQIDALHGATPACIAPRVPEGASCNLDSLAPGFSAAPFSPHGGLRISLAELTALGRMLADGGVANGKRFLKAETIAEFARPIWILDQDGADGASDHGTVCAYGSGLHLLGVSPSPLCRDDLFGDGRPRFGHAAEAYGLLGGLWMDPDRREVIAYFATGTASDPLLRRGPRSGFTAIEEALAAAARR